jgi:hypothetical protein
MKNWAIVAVAAAISGVVFAKADEYPTIATFGGVVLVYCFVLRFYVRAMLCYINLTRGNLLQSRCLALKLKDDEDDPPIHPADVRRDIQNYYHRWLSPMGRNELVLANLTLGFGLLFALPLGLVAWGGVTLVSDSVAQGIIVFALGHTFIEANDFLRSHFFDDVAACERRRAKGKGRHIFPVPVAGAGYAWMWALVVALSLLAAGRPPLFAFLRALRTLYFEGGICFSKRLHQRNVCHLLSRH